jgi:hypothetical protein
MGNPIKPGALLVGVLLVATGCGPHLEPLEAWDMTMKRVRACSVVGEGQENCVPEDELDRRVLKGRWIVEHTPDQSFSVTLENGATFSGITFADDGATLEEATPPCLGNGGLCYFARDRSLSFDENDNSCGRMSEHTVVMRLTEEEGSRKLEAVVRDLSLVDRNCQAPAQTELIDTGTGVYDPEHISRAQAEQTQSEEAP